MAEVHASTAVAHPAEAEHAEPTFLGLNPGGWVALAMLAVFALLIVKRVPAAIGKALDKKIDSIRGQLAEAEALREEAEQLKAEYAAKAAAAESEAAAMIERARQEADAMLEKARRDADSLVERRTKMAEEKIAAEERAAIQQLRSAAADATVRAAARLIAERVDSGTDAALVDSAIKDLGKAD
jgi:F-type H+-transporting ATPase subunit b